MHLRCYQQKRHLLSHWYLEPQNVALLLCLRPDPNPAGAVWCDEWSEQMKLGRHASTERFQCAPMQAQCPCLRPWPARSLHDHSQCQQIVGHTTHHTAFRWSYKAPPSTGQNRKPTLAMRLMQIETPVYTDCDTSICIAQTNGNFKSTATYYLEH